ncbi:MAG: 3-oxoacyl-ACP synthase, partial [Halanaerobium sp.]|nr:3-oxoacyl-ACP synthase [Halanaerobium sp.]
MTEISPHVGIVGTGLYLPENRMTAREISEATGGYWSEEAVKEKLGVSEKVMPGKKDGTQEMGARAAKNALERTGIGPEEIDLLICIGEEWKEYPLTTSGIYIQEQIGAANAWAVDVQLRCCTTVAAMKMAKDMLLANDDYQTVMLAGGYRNCDFVDYQSKPMSMMYNLGAGGGAIILKKNYGRNVLLGTHLMSDGSMARDVGVKYGGVANPITRENVDEAYKSLMIFNPEHMKDRLNEVSMQNWMKCIDEAFKKSGIEKAELGYLAVLHFKYSMH